MDNLLLPSEPLGTSVYQKMKNYRESKSKTQRSKFIFFKNPL